MTTVKLSNHKLYFLNRNEVRAGIALLLAQDLKIALFLFFCVSEIQEKERFTTRSQADSFFFRTFMIKVSKLWPASESMLWCNWP